ncbi:Enzymatic polyprotein [Trichinella spiralis]|uniref:Enzymatic polyprotein n=1 Tax=Trichinella spiralis TaxID=6334 RepID=A0ABR3KCP6_TRISP
MPVDEKSQKYLTTHIGYFQYKKLPFGITAAPAIYKRIDGDGIHPTMERVEAIAETTSRKNVKERRTFLGADYKIEYRKGKQNYCADALSRLPMQTEEPYTVVNREIKRINMTKLDDLWLSEKEKFEEEHKKRTSWHNIAAVKALTRYYIWWVNCERDIEMFVENCYPYQENRENE